MAKAVDKALNMTNSNDTLIVVTSDHSHTITLAGYPSRGNDILGPSNINFASDSLEYVTLSYANGPGYRKEIVNSQTLETSRPDVAKEPDFIASKYFCRQEFFFSITLIFSSGWYNFYSIVSHFVFFFSLLITILKGSVTWPYFGLLPCRGEWSINNRIKPMCTKHENDIYLTLPSNNID